MEPATARIPARSHRQAMDWSLVLVSQGIEALIENPAEGAGWGLVVGAQDYARALEAIRQYRLENREWPWRQEVFRPGFLFDWGSSGWAALVAIFFWLSTRADLRTPGSMDSVAVAHGQWWRLFTAIWLHADLGHLISNLTFGFVLIGLAMGRYGTGAGLLLAYLAGAAGNCGTWLVATARHQSLGASGMVMGALGLLAMPSFALWRQTARAPKVILGGIVGGGLLFVLLGLTPGTDVMAHFGGFVCGLLLGGPLTLVPELAQRPKINLLSGLLFTLLVIVPWWLALKTGWRPGP
jgi:membrane associated rhomboid family serine protease